ncbi:MAG: hypothetical protein JST29_05665 [Bacteroidetes bacterium]|nr:hypothetical protein [Bacteroidota bacterium]
MMFFFFFKDSSAAEWVTAISTLLLVVVTSITIYFLKKTYTETKNSLLFERDKQRLSLMPFFDFERDKHDNIAWRKEDTMPLGTAYISPSNQKTKERIAEDIKSVKYFNIINKGNVAVRITHIDSSVSKFAYGGVRAAAKGQKIKFIVVQDPFDYSNLKIELLYNDMFANQYKQELCYSKIGHPCLILKKDKNETST